MLDSMQNPGTPHTLDLPMDQIERVEKILEQVLTYLRSQARALPPEADLALTYNLQPAADK
jgi:hypothetical protein